MDSAKMTVFEVPSVAALAAATGATSAIAAARSVAFSALLVMDGKTPPAGKTLAAYENGA